MKQGQIYFEKIILKQVKLHLIEIFRIFTNALL